MLAANLTGCKLLELKQSNLDSVNKAAHKEIIKPSSPALEVCEAIESPDDPESYLNTWERAEQQFKLNIPNNRRVRAQKSWYLNHPSYLERVSKRAAPY